MTLIISNKKKEIILSTAALEHVSVFLFLHQLINSQIL